VGILRIVTGFTLLALGVLAAIPLPEIGVPLLLVGLRLLGSRFEWARRANVRVEAGWGATRRWFHGLHVVSKSIVAAALIAVAVGLVWFGASHV